MKLSFSTVFILLISMFFVNTNTTLANLESHKTPVLEQKESFTKKFKSFENKILNRLMTKRVKKGLTKVKQFFKSTIGERQLLKIVLVVVLVILLAGLISTLLSSLPLIRNIIVALVFILLILYLIKQVL